MGKPGYQIWPALLMILVGGTVFVGLMATSFSPKRGAMVSSDDASREKSVVARADLTSAQRGGVAARAMAQRASGTRSAGRSARGDAVPDRHGAGLGAPGHAEAGGQVADDPGQSPEGTEADGRARHGSGGAGVPGSSAVTEEPSSAVPPVSTDPAGQYGIEVASLRMTAGGTALDFRYKVVDADKAAKVGREGGPSYILDKEGRRISPRNVQQIGDYYSARHLDRPGNTYSTWFANQGGILRSGDVVSVVIGDLRVADVRVE